MGANFYVCCHKCKVTAFCLRDFVSVGEVLTLFFNQHYDCGKLDSKNVEVVWSYFDNPKWLNIYKDVSLDFSSSLRRLENGNKQI